MTSNTSGKPQLNMEYRDTHLYFLTIISLQRNFSEKATKEEKENIFEVCKRSVTFLIM